MELSYLTSVLKQFQYYKHLGEKAIAQLPEDRLFWQYDQESNSIAVIVNHMAGNMLSRFTDFLSTDGEKPWRNRDAEFENPFTDAGQIMEQWERGWKVVFEAIEGLTESELERITYGTKGTLSWKH